VYIGHVGAALAAKRARPSIGLFALLVATYMPDWVDGALCAAGRYNPVIMISHTLPTVVLFAGVGFVLYGLKTRDWAAALVVAGVILSHAVLDWVTGYKPIWPGGRMIGLGLYDRPAADFIVEGVVIVIGLVLYARTLPPRRRPWIDVSLMLGALLALQLAIDIAHMMMKSLPKC
jgi:LexA-binding, inner membrane-associated putative hydrolase